MDTLLFFFYGLAYIGLFSWGLFLAKNNHWLTSANAFLFVIAALIYDNGVVAFGRYIGEGEVLERLNYARSWLHALFTPLLVLFAWNTLKRAEIRWALKKWVKYGTYLFVLGLILLEVMTSIVGLRLEAKWEHGVLSYQSVKEQEGAPWMVIIITAILLLASIIIWRKLSWPWFFIGTSLMTIGSLLMIWIERAVVINASELILMTTLVMTKRFQDNLKT
jgi:hypothetical protein